MVRGQRVPSGGRTPLTPGDANRGQPVAGASCIPQPRTGSASVPHRLLHVDRVKPLLLAAALALSSSPDASAAADNAKPLQLRPKAALAAAAEVTPSREAPFVTPLGEPAVDFSPHVSQRHSPNSACGPESTLCYDMSDGGRIVFRPARKLMPEISGLTRENISVKRDRIIFRYSF